MMAFDEKIPEEFIKIGAELMVAPCTVPTSDNAPTPMICAEES